MSTTDRRSPALEDYINALTVARATLLNDDDGLYVVLANCNAGQLVQAMTRTYLQTLLGIVGSLEQVDAYLRDSLADLQRIETTDEQDEQ